MRNPLTPFLALLGLWVGLTGPTARAAGSPAGSEIVNQASATFTDPAVAGPQNVLSNTVKTVLSAVCSVSISPASQAKPYQAGGKVFYDFTAVNTGNQANSYALGLVNLPSTLGPVKLYLDSASGPEVNLANPLALALDASQALVLEVSVPAGTIGDLSSTLTASCSEALGGQRATFTGTSKLGAQLLLKKTFSSTKLSPGGTVTVTLELSNASTEFDAQNVVLEDLFKNTLNAGGESPFTLVAGSAAPSSGFETVTGGVRWNVGVLTKGANRSFSFQLKVADTVPASQLGIKTNVATVTGQDGTGTPLPTVRAEAPIVVEVAPQIALGPIGNPRADPGGEGSESDRQIQPTQVGGGSLCFSHTLENLGSNADQITIVSSGGSSVVFRKLNGDLLTFPVTLQPGEKIDFQACYLVSGAFEATLTATSQKGAPSNSTKDALVRIIVPGAALGPVNKPEAPEGTPADSQTQPSASLGKPICFEHTLKNTGTDPDGFFVSGIAVKGAATVDVQISQPIALQPGQSVSFKVCYTPTQEGTLEVRLTATSSLGASNTTTDSVTEVIAAKLALGPVGNPQANPGGEGSASDLQIKESALLKQPICFEHTLENLSKADDSVTVSGVLSSGTGSVSFFNLDGSPLAFPVQLKAQGQSGDKFSFKVCYTLTAAGTGANALEAILTASSALGAAPNLTRDQVKKVFEGVPTLEKSVNVDLAKPVKQGDTLTYTLKVSNPFSFALTKITVRDVLDINLDPSSAILSNGGKLEGNTALWTVDTLAPGASLTLTVTVKVKTNVLDGVRFINRFLFSSDEVSSPLPSNEVSLLIWGASLTLEKKADVAQVDLGGELGWTLKIFNTSKNATLVQMTLEDTLPLGLTYLPGSAKLDGVLLSDPTVTGQKLSFILANPIAPGATVTVTFRTKVGANAAELLINAAQVSGKGQDDATSNLTAVASNVAKSQVVKVNPRVFGAKGELLGRVYLDINGDGAFSFAQDLPQSGVRLILADGRSVLTDVEGRYHFQSLPEGMWGLRLDPNSVPFRAAPEVHDGGKRGSRNMNVFAITVADFPLELPVGSVYACRTTTLRVGEVSLEKSILRVALNTYRVTLTLSTPTALEKLKIGDPLPMGATALEGTNTFEGNVTAGTRTFVYSFTFPPPRDGSPPRDGLSTLTDPEMGWSYP